MPAVFLLGDGVKTEVIYAGCCGMLQVEQGNVERVAERARSIDADIMKWVNDGYDVIALVLSCALMLKFEWPLLLPDDENVKGLTNATHDVFEYVADITKKEGLAEGLGPLDGDITVQLA